MVSSLWSFTKQNLSIPYSSEVTLNYAQCCLRLLLPCLKYFCDMVYSAPYSRWKDHRNFIFLGGISGEGEEKRYSGFGVCINFVEEAQTRRQKRDQRIHSFNRRQSSSVWASYFRPWSKTWAVSYLTLHWKKNLKLDQKENNEKHFKLLMDEKRTELDKKQWTHGTNKWLLVTSFGFPNTSSRAAFWH